MDLNSAATDGGKSFFAECVAHAANRLEQASLAALLQLVPQIAHIHIDNLGAAEEIRSPDGLKDHLSSKHAVWIAKKELQELKLARSEIQAFAGSSGLSRCWIKLDVAVPYYLAGVRTR